MQNLQPNFTLSRNCYFYLEHELMIARLDYSPLSSSVHGDSSGKNNWSGLPCPPPGDLPNPGIKPRSSAVQADSLLVELPGKLNKDLLNSEKEKKLLLDLFI